jgi:predicted nucleotidyltransferase
MPRIEAHLVPVVTELAHGLRELGVPFGIVGALVPELLLDARPPQATNDADVTVVVETLADFEALKDRLDAYGFTRTNRPYRMQYRGGGLIDLLPFSEALAPSGRLQLEEGFSFNMAGFGKVVPNCILISIDGGPTIPVAPLALYVLLKLVAFGDRKAHKDLRSVLHCLEHYLEDDERRYGLEYGAEGVPFEYTCAHLLGLDGRPFLDQSLRTAATTVLDRFNDPDAEAVGIAASSSGQHFVGETRRVDVFELFRWYRLGAGL